MRALLTITLLWAVCWVAALPAVGQGGSLELLTQNGSVVINLVDAKPASQLQVGMVWLAPAYSRAGGYVTSVQCLATGRNRGQLQGGMTLSLGGRIFDEDWESTLTVLSRKTRPFNPAARFSWDLPDYSANHDVLTLLVEGNLSGGQQLDLVKVVCQAIQRLRCRADGDTMCLVGNNRFKVELDFGSSKGRVAASTPRSGRFTVANPGQADVVVELFDRCALNDHYWVGVGSTTARSFEVVVEDTLSGETRSFSNPGNGMVMVDPSAFPTCP